jgi:hypothetical protein
VGNVDVLTALGLDEVMVAASVNGDEVGLVVAQVVGVIGVLDDETEL